MSYFEPIIGSGFDAIAGQRQFWAQHNAGVDSANIARAMEAEKQRNDYSQNLAAQQRAEDSQQQVEDNQNRAYQFSVAQQARQDAETQARDKQHAYEFSTNVDLAKAEARRRDAENKARNTQAADALDEKSYEFDTALDENKKTVAQDLQNQGQSFATTYAASQRKLSAAKDAANALQEEHDTLTNKVTELGQIKDKSDADIASLSTANKRLGELKKILPKALGAQTRLEQRHIALSDQMSARGFVPNDEDGTLTHLTSGKTWTFKGALNAAKNVQSGAVETASATAEDVPGSNYFAPPTSTATSAPAPDVSLLNSDAGYARDYFNSRPQAEQGTVGVPFTPKSVQEFQQLPNGAWYIDPGSNMKKQKGNAGTALNPAQAPSKIVIQNGSRFKINPDGSSVYLGGA